MSLPGALSANSAAMSISPLLRLASAHCRPPDGELERPVVAQAIDRDVLHLGAAGEDLAFRRPRRRCR